MRISPERTDFLKNTIRQYSPDARVHLFGSRVDDDKKGGDIDIMVIGGKRLSSQEVRRIKIEFYKEYGEQKIDIVSFDMDDSSGFKELVLLESVEL